MDDKFYMQQALNEALKALEEDEVPVGAIIVYQSKIIARSYNQVRRLKDPTAHAEILAITQAASFLNYERLNGCKIYVTIEPCVMCAGALILSRVDKLIYGASDNRQGAFGSLLDITKYKDTHHKIKVKSGILREESASLIQDFFKEKRSSLQ
ncbi:MAG: tRNA adenosine(34) deaminase TadA [Candidatus Saelkia tenebricola]|nr:tRNA adenosine(34) deaminase TadA [Candidatus Saelkia tenebricola]